MSIPISNNPIEQKSNYLKFVETSVMSEISKAISYSLNLNNVLGFTSDILRTFIGVEGVTVAVIDKSIDELTVPYSMPELSRRDVKQRIKKYRGIVENLVHTGSCFYKDMETGSVIIPLRGENQIIGLLDLNSAGLKIFPDDEIQDMLVTISSQVSTAIQNARLYHELQKSVRIATGLYSIAKLVETDESLNHITEEIVQTIQSITKCNECTILVTDPDDGTFLTEFTSGGKNSLISSQIARSVLESRKSMIIPRVEISNAISEYSFSVMCIPLIIRDKILGVAGITFDSMTATEDDSQLFKMIVQQVSLSIERILSMRKAEKHANIDSMTELYNYRYFSERLEEEVSRAIRYYEPMSIILLDVDDFKNYNDTFGHLAGNIILRQVSKVLKKKIRRSDVVCRYGGEEFVIILPSTSKADAIKVGEKVRQAVRSEVFPNRQITASVGISSMPEDALSASDIINMADKAMYTAKMKGKDCVVEYSA